MLTDSYNLVDGNWVHVVGYKSVNYIAHLTVTDDLKHFGKGLCSASPEGGYAWYAGIQGARAYSPRLAATSRCLFDQPTAGGVRRLQHLDRIASVTSHSVDRAHRSGIECTLEVLMPDDRQRLVELLTELWNTANAELASQIYSERARRSDPGMPETANGVQQIMSFVDQVHSGFPDFQIRVVQQINDKDRLVTEWISSGTHRGEFFGVPATGKRVDLNGTTISRVENGKIIEERTYYDRLNLLEQMGVTPASSESPAKAAATTR